MSNYNNTDIAARLEVLMDENGIRSVHALAKKVGLDCSNLLKKKKGIVPFTERDVMAISYGLKVCKPWLVFGEGDKYLPQSSHVSDEMLDENTRLRIEKARLEERVKCLEKEKSFIQRMLDK